MCCSVPPVAVRGEEELGNGRKVPAELCCLLRAAAGEGRLMAASSPTTWEGPLSANTPEKVHLCKH